MRDMGRRRVKKPAVIVVILLIITLCSVIFFYQYLFNNVNAIDRDEINREMGLITEDIIRALEEDIKSDAEPSEDIPPRESEQGELEDAEQALVDTDKVGKAVARIKAAYEKGFLKLENEGNLMVDRLLESAKADYVQLRDAEGDTAELLELVSIYSNRGKAMEKSMDSTVETLIGRLNSELKAAGMSKSDSKAYINEIRIKYEAQKESRRNLVLDKAKKYL